MPKNSDFLDKSWDPRVGPLFQSEKSVLAKSAKSSKTHIYRRGALRHNKTEQNDAVLPVLTVFRRKWTSLLSILPDGYTRVLNLAKLIISLGDYCMFQAKQLVFSLQGCIQGCKPGSRAWTPPMGIKGRFCQLCLKSGYFIWNI